MGSPVKNCPGISLICQSESVRRGPILSGCDIYWGIVQDAHVDANKGKLNRLDRLEVNKSMDNLLYTVDRDFPAINKISSRSKARSRRNGLAGERYC